VRFGRFELDPVAGELFRRGTRLRLQEQPLQVLIALLERPGELVTREELRERLWKGNTFVDFEHGLNTAVKKARQALGDSAESPEFIETVARRGYRFIADVQVITPAPLAVPSPAAGDHGTADAPRDRVSSPPARPVRRWRRALLWGTGAALLIAAGAGGWLARRQATPGPSPAGQQPPAHLAVMPLRVLADAGDDVAYLGVGIADAITTRLANTRQMGPAAHVGGPPLHGRPGRRRPCCNIAQRCAPVDRNHSTRRGGLSHQSPARAGGRRRDVGTLV
jgi:DNA-binding winged helix-turn-helix (wHTH) protein